MTSWPTGTGRATVAAAPLVGTRYHQALFFPLCIADAHRLACANRAPVEGKARRSIFAFISLLIIDFACGSKQGADLRIGRFGCLERRISRHHHPCAQPLPVFHNRRGMLGSVSFVPPKACHAAFSAAFRSFMSRCFVVAFNSSGRSSRHSGGDLPLARADGRGEGAASTAFRYRVFPPRRSAASGDRHRIEPRDRPCGYHGRCAL